MNIEQRKEKEIEHILETYSKEVKEYEKIGNRKNFKKIFKEIKKLNKYDLKFEDFYPDENKIYGNTKIQIDNIKIHFMFHDFYSWDSKAMMEDYLEGKKYNLDICFDDYELIEFETLETGYKCLLEIKTIIDRVLKENI